MYKPTDVERPQYPVFAKVNGRIIPFLSIKGVIAIAATLALGIGLFVAFSMLTHEIDIEVAQADRSIEYDSFKAQRAAVRLDAAQDELAPYEDGDGKPRADLSAEDKMRYQEIVAGRSSVEVTLSVYTPDQRADLAVRAAENGIAAETSDAELEAMVAKTKREVVPVIDDFMRFVIFVFLPLGACIASVVEIDGMSLVSAISDRVAFRRKQHVYFYRRIS